MVSRISFFRFWGKIPRYLWVGRARHPGPPSNNLDVEVFNVGGFLTHGDYVLKTDADFIAVVEHRLVPARARSEGKRLLQAGIRSVWAPASLEGRHVGQAGVGVVSLSGAHISLPSIATFGFSEFFQLGRVLRCHLPVSGGRVVHLVVVYGFQGASTDPEKLRLPEKLPRGQRMDRAGGWERAALHGHVPEHPTPQAAGTEYFSLDVEDVPAAGLRPGVLAEPRPQERVPPQGSRPPCLGEPRGPQARIQQRTMHGAARRGRAHGPDSGYSCAADG